MGEPDVNSRVVERLLSFIELLNQRICDSRLAEIIHMKSKFELEFTIFLIVRLRKTDLLLLPPCFATFARWTTEGEKRIKVRMPNTLA